MTREEAMTRALDALHTIGGAMQIRRTLAERGQRLSAPLLESLTARCLTDKQIEDMALTAWADIVENVRPVLPDTQVHVCAPESMEPWTHDEGGGQ